MVLKKARRKFFNELLGSEKGFDILRGLVNYAQTYSPKFMGVSKNISLLSDDEDEEYDPRQPLFHMPSLTEIDPDLDGNSTKFGLSSWMDPDMSGRDRFYPMYSSNRRKTAERRPIEPPSVSIPIPPLQKRWKLEVESAGDIDAFCVNSNDKTGRKMSKREKDERFDIGEDNVRYDLAYEHLDRDTDDKDIEYWITHKSHGKVFADPHKDPFDFENDDMFSETWSNEATAPDSDDEGSYFSVSEEDLEQLEYEADEEDYTMGAWP